MTRATSPCIRREYADQGNSAQSVTQGSPDVESPHAGATGGNVTVNSCDPENARRFRVSQTLGGLSLTRSFIRFDTGRFADDKLKMFFSYSHTQADKWKGKASQKGITLTPPSAWDLDAGERHPRLGALQLRRQQQHLQRELAQLDANGYYYDFGDTFVGHLPPVKGTAQKETTPRRATTSRPSTLPQRHRVAVGARSNWPKTPR